MAYLIDSDYVIDHHLDELPAAISLLNRLVQDGIAINMVTYLEVYEGIVR